MSSEKKVDCGRRNLVFATAAVGGVATVATAVPFLASMSPSERAKAAGAPVEADIGKIADKISDAQSKRPMQPEYARNDGRSIKPEYLVVVGICTHLGCSPTDKFKTGAESGINADWPGGFICPCHGSLFDLAGRVYKNMPAPDNLEVPPHYYLSDTRILIGEDKKA